MSWAEKCRAAIVQKLGDVGQEYIREAEHQDGEVYWANFESVSEAVEDAERYAAHA